LELQVLLKMVVLRDGAVEVQFVPFLFTLVFFFS
jgi:hypothetical protein